MTASVAPDCHPGVRAAAVYINRSDIGNHAYWVDWNGSSSGGWHATPRTY